MDIKLDKSGNIYFKNISAKASIGKNGINFKKREGDCITPTGVYPLRTVLYRADRIQIPATLLPSRMIEFDDGWCTDPLDPNYNMMIKLPINSLNESLWRNDNLYDIIIPIGYNDNPVTANLGSAIFIHIAKNNFKPTEGCIGVEINTMLKIIENCDIQNYITISM